MEDPFKRKQQQRSAFKSRIAGQYKLTVETYNHILDLQNGKCAICENFSPDRALAVDHNHATKQIRGLLCTYCNSVVVNLLENRPELLAKAKVYLEVGHGKDWNSSKV